MKIAIPLYDDPDQNPTSWSAMFDAGSAVGISVIEPDFNGTAADPAMVPMIAAGQAAGEKVIGYTYTNSAARAIADVEADVTAFYNAYPNIDGIFVDEVAEDDSTVASYYLPLYQYIKAAHPNALVVINPGTMEDEIFMSACDIIMSYEDTYAAYIDPNQNPPVPSWVANYPASRFWNIIQEADAGVIASVVATAKANNVGWIYVTAEGPNTAYSVIDIGSYFEAEIADVVGP